jgi:1-acyl-sn-glycerol-3-phosphate acyltransferase
MNFSRWLDYPSPTWRIYSLFATVSMFISVAIWGLVILVRLLFPLNLQTETWYLRVWNLFVLKLYRMKVEIVGQEKLASGKSCLIVSNHQSLFDIPLAFKAISKEHIRMVAKRELFKIPIFGHVLYRTHFIPVDRKSRTSGVVASQEMRKRLNAGISVWVAPEGTRSVNSQLLPFRKGAFAVAIDEKIPVQPLLILNSYRSCTKEEYWVRCGSHLVVHILEPLYPDHPAFADRGLLCEEVQRRMAEALAKAQAKDPSLFLRSA